MHNDNSEAIRIDILLARIRDLEKEKRELHEALWEIRRKTNPTEFDRLINRPEIFRSKYFGDTIRLQD